MDDYGKLLLRLGFGGMMLTHGIPKLMKLFGGAPYKFPDLFGLGSFTSLLLAVFTEVICVLLVMIGYKTKLVSLPVVVTMLVAAFYVHMDDPWGKKEFALVYGLGFLAISMLGAGKYSVDKN